MTQIGVTSEASTLGDAMSADLRTISTALTGGFTTPGGIHQALSAISRIQDNLPALRRELRAMRAGIRRVA